MSLNNARSKTDANTNMPSLENKNDFPYFSNFFNRRMNYLINLNEESKPNIYSNLGYSNFSTNINATNKEQPILNKPKKRNTKNFFKESDKEPEFKFWKEPELGQEEKNFLLEENSSIPLNHPDNLKPLLPMKNSFMELKDKIIQSKDSLKDDFSKKDEEKAEKAETICKEIAMLAQDILDKSNQNEQIYKLEKEIEIFERKMEQINSYFKNNHQLNDNNLEVFQKIKDFLNENNKMTGYEVHKFRFCENFLEFMFEGRLPTIYDVIHRQKKANSAEFLQSLIVDSEEKIIENEKKEFNQADHVSSILQRIIAFYFYFSKHSMNDSKGIF